MLDMERRVTQTRVGRDAELLFASNAGLFKPASEVLMLLEMRGPRFSSKRNLCVEVRLASDDLTLVIFGQPTPIYCSYCLIHPTKKQSSKIFLDQEMVFKKRKRKKKDDKFTRICIQLEGARFPKSQLEYIF